MRRIAQMIFLGSLLAAWLHAQRIDLGWPTPNKAFAEGKPISAYLQQAGSGDPESGGFGGVRSGGRQFHEGIDIMPVGRDKRGEPTDMVMAAMDGVVRHINSVAGNSSYGRYIVLEHPDVTPGVYTLYGHLAKIAPGLKRGDQVRRGQALGIMGRSAAGYAIPRERAHLHFEIGVWVARDFQAWYDWKKFGSRNEHGLYNGMNLLGLDPLDFFREYRARRINNFQEYFSRMEPAVKLRIATLRRPDFIQRYPSLLSKPAPLLTAGWEIWFNWTGLPYKWTPLAGAEVAGMAPNQVRIMEVNAALERRERSKSLAYSLRGAWVPGKDLKIVLQQLFGLRE